MINPIHFPKTSNIIKPQNIQKQTVVIGSKNGKDVISDVFVGDHVMRENFLELIVNLLWKTK